MAQFGPYYAADYAVGTKLSAATGFALASGTDDVEVIASPNYGNVWQPNSSASSPVYLQEDANESATAEVLAQIYIASDALESLFGVLLSDMPDSTTFYRSGVRGGSPDIERFVNGSFSGIAESSQEFFGTDIGNYAYFRTQKTASDGRIRVRLFGESSNISAVDTFPTEPSGWDIDVANSDITTLGKVGVAWRTGSEHGLRWISFGTDGDSAPTEPVTSTAPTLNAVSATNITATSITPNVELTDAAAGTLYWAVYPSGQTNPSAADIKAETVANGDGYGSDTSPTTDGAFAGSTIPGLTAGTSYKLAVVWDDGTDTSAVAVSGAFLTDVVVGQTTETDTALGVNPQISTPAVILSQGVETDSAFPVLPEVLTPSTAVSQATESDTALSIQSLLAPQSIQIGLASESDTAIQIGASAGDLLRFVGQASEADTAISINAVTQALSNLNIAQESDTAFPIISFQPGVPQTIPIGISQETDSGFPVTGNAGVLQPQTADVNQAQELSTAFAMTPVQVQLPQTIVIGFAGEIDTANRLGAGGQPLISDPVSVVGIAGEVVQFEVEIAGNDQVSIQWYDQNGPVAFAVQPVYRRELFPDDDGGGVYVVVTNDVASTTSNTATMTVGVSEDGVLDIEPITYRLRLGRYREPFYKNGTAILSRPLAEGEFLSIERKTPITNDLTFQARQQPNWQAFEYQINKLTMVEQEIEGHFCDCRGLGVSGDVSTAQSPFPDAAMPFVIVQTVPIPVGVPEFFLAVVNPSTPAVETDFYQAPAAPSGSDYVNLPGSVIETSAFADGVTLIRTIRDINSPSAGAISPPTLTSSKSPIVIYFNGPYAQFSINGGMGFLSGVSPALSQTTIPGGGAANKSTNFGSISEVLTNTIEVLNVPNSSNVAVAFESVEYDLQMQDIAGGDRQTFTNLLRSVYPAIPETVSVPLTSPSSAAGTYTYGFHDFISGLELLNRGAIGFNTGWILNSNVKLRQLQFVRYKFGG